MEYKGYELTPEQYNYITYSDKIDTKLIACAGSGKTQCIVLKNIFLLENNIYTSDELLILVFGRHAQNDLTNRVSSVDTDKLINSQCISTIDALSKYIIDDNNKIDVSLLSYKFMEYLENTSIDKLKENIKLNKIKCIFVDEAQDLNYIQFRIVMLIKEKLGAILNFIGDQNQNIFQFRDSESKYFTEFNGKEFLLTTNFRSSEEIIEFSKNLRADKSHNIVSSKGKSNIKPKIYIDSDIPRKIEQLISEFYDDDPNFNLSSLAIISPVKGKISHNSATGLCMVANVLSGLGINFMQFYDESKEENNPNLKYEPIDKHCSLITICGSKGLQWQHIILIGAKSCLINYYTFTEKQHNDEKNLLYVGTSRSIETLSIIVDENKKSVSINHWFQDVDEDTYEIITDTAHKKLTFPQLRFNNEIRFDNKITRIIDNIPIHILNELSNIIDYDNINKEITKIYDNDFSKVEFTSPILLGKFIESFFVNCIKLKNNQPLKEYYDIKNISNNTNIHECTNNKLIEWISNNKYLSWEQIDIIKDKLGTLYNEILLLKNKNKNNLLPLEKYSFLIINNYYKTFVLNNKEWIKKIYDKYTDFTDLDNLNKFKKILFYCEIIQHALQTQHYYHIKNKGSKYATLLLLYKDMLDKIVEYVKTIPDDFIEFNKYIEAYDLCGEIDAIDSNNQLWEIKVVKDIQLKHILQLLLYNIMNNKQTNYKLNFINFLKGEKVIINLNLDEYKINRIIDIFQKYSSTRKN